MANISRVEQLRRGLRLVALLQRPRSVAELAEALDLSHRDVQRLLGDYQAAGFELERTADHQHRWYRVAGVPGWFRKALKTLRAAGWTGPRAPR